MTNQTNLDPKISVVSPFNPDAQCLTCAYFYAYPVQKKETDTLGLCIFDPPKAQSGSIVAKFPIIMGSFVCGQHPEYFGKRETSVT